MARPQHEPTEVGRQQVHAMVGYGIPEDQIAVIMNISPKTLRKHYQREIAVGAIVANANVAQNLHRIATGNSAQAADAAKFWLRCRAGWSEYAPAPSIKTKPKGKKAQQRLDAEHAADGTPWDEILPN